MLACGQSNRRHIPRMAARGIFNYSMIAAAKVNSNLVPPILSPIAIRRTTHIKHGN
jgi:hypothetical protein